MTLNSACTHLLKVALFEVDSTKPAKATVHGVSRQLHREPSLSRYWGIFASICTREYFASFSDTDADRFFLECLDLDWIILWWLSRCDAPWSTRTCCIRQCFHMCSQKQLDPLIAPADAASARLSFKSPVRIQGVILWVVVVRHNHFWKNEDGSASHSLIMTRVLWLQKYSLSAACGKCTQPSVIHQIKNNYLQVVVGGCMKGNRSCSPSLLLLIYTSAASRLPPVLDHCVVEGRLRI